ncbi:hypothetical protein F511_28882 [Dorcoceras hygrometricum]|uniref:Uncharacterized protein n=1 Tax=Dorcoceras hygrometricum TaxID=472368 RepID=A0A2Z7D0H7_9LAMI|nr:hypothetical protein F511_28882 [Dorcoceras hygrometricum]
MQHAINQCYECMKAIKGRIARPASQLAINQSSLYTTHSKSAGGNHRSMIFRARQPIIARWSSDTTSQSVTTPMIALDFQAQQVIRPVTTWLSNSLNQQENNETDFSKKLRTPVATRFHSNANSGLQMGSNQKSNSQRVQRHQNHSNHRRRTATIDRNREHCDVLSIQMDSDLVIYRNTLVRTFQVMLPRRRGGGRGKFQEESEGQNEEVQRSGPFRRRDSQIEGATFPVCAVIPATPAADIPTVWTIEV